MVKNVINACKWFKGLVRDTGINRFQQVARQQLLNAHLMVRLFQCHIDLSAICDCLYSKYVTNASVPVCFALKCICSIKKTAKMYVSRAQARNMLDINSAAIMLFPSFHQARHWAYQRHNVYLYMHQNVKSMVVFCHSCTPSVRASLNL